MTASRLGVLVGLVMLVTSCAGSTVQDQGLDGVSGLGDGPPPLTVSGGTGALGLDAFAYCWSETTGEEREVVCADGEPPDPLPSIVLSGGDRLLLEFPLDWTFEAGLRSTTQSCDTVYVVGFDATGHSTSGLGPAGTSRVTVTGRGGQGDAVWAFELTMTVGDAPPPPFVQINWQPSARDPSPDASFHAAIGNLADPRSDSSATVTVTSADGQSRTFGLRPTDPGACWAGRAGFLADASASSEILDLGSPPYQVVLEATVDGDSMIFEPITWPADFRPNSSQSRRADLADQ